MRLTPAALVVLALIFFPLPAAGQATTTGTIDIIVVDTQKGVVPGATVTLQDVDRGNVLTRTTDGDGAATFLAVPVGTYELKAEMQGFARVTFSNVRVNPGTTQPFRFELPVGTLAEAVSVSAEPPLIDTHRSHESTTLEGRYLDTVPLLTRNMTELPTVFPGVSYSRSSRLAYQHFDVRGGALEDNLYLLDGGSLNRGGGRAGILVAPSFVERIEFLPGGFPAEYGGRQSSMINLVSKSGTNQMHGFLSAIAKPNAFYSDITSGLATQVRAKPVGNSQFYEASLGGPLRRDRVWYFAGFQYNKDAAGTILSLDPEPRTVTVVPAHVKLSYQQDPSKRWELTAHVGPFSDVHQTVSTEVAAESNTRQDINTWDIIARQTFVRGSSSVWETTFQTFYMDFLSGKPVDDREVRPGEYFVRYFDRALGHFYTRGPATDVSGVNNELRFTLGTKFTRMFSGHTVKVGGEVIVTSGGQPRFRTAPRFTDLRNTGGAVTRLDPFDIEGSIDDRRVDMFVQDSWTPISRLTLDLGFRFDWQQKGGSGINPAPRIGLTLDPTGTRRSKVYANVGLYYSEVFQGIFGYADSNVRQITYTVRNPDANLVGQDAVRSIQNFLVGDLHNSYIAHYSAGYEYLFPGQMKGVVTLVKRRGRHQPSGRAQTVSAVEVNQFQETDGKLEYRGIELTLQKALSHQVEGLVSYTLGKSENNAPGLLSPLQQQFSFGPADYDQRHTLTGSGTVLLPAALQVTALYRFASGRPYSITNSDPSIFAAFVDRQGRVTGRNQERLVSSWTVDFSGSRDFTFGSTKIRALVQAINLTNRVNVLAVSTALVTAGRPINIDLSRQLQVGVELRF